MTTISILGEVGNDEFMVFPTGIPVDISQWYSVAQDSTSYGTVPRRWAMKIIFVEEMRKTKIKMIHLGFSSGSLHMTSTYNTTKVACAIPSVPVPTQKQLSDLFSEPVCQIN